ncbi:MAG: hypothetical protein QOG80_154 [Pseudonocardiales bacterium]|jgi:hypothetical protein|nr:hypothetical protein [Pseudonocardiales bacterium]
MQLGIRRRLRAQAPFLTVVAIVVGVVIYLTIQPGHWRRATAVIGLAMLWGAFLRLVLPAQHAGLLAVRGRYWDALYYGMFGVLILVVDIRLRT